jgi:hypothetical protein
MYNYELYGVIFLSFIMLIEVIFTSIIFYLFFGKIR